MPYIDDRMKEYARNVSLWDHIFIDSLMNISVAIGKDGKSATVRLPGLGIDDFNRAGKLLLYIFLILKKCYINALLHCITFYASRSFKFFSG